RAPLQGASRKLRERWIGRWGALVLYASSEPPSKLGAKELGAKGGFWSFASLGPVTLWEERSAGRSGFSGSISAPSRGRVGSDDRMRSYGEELVGGEEVRAERTEAR